MKISRLRLTGFKSFVEPTELLIEPGLTGVVGPNGCGKSNLLEALRWVMGETSHKSMRGSSMEDVIFSGTTARPARNVAEVAILIDNAERRAPAEYNGGDVIEIVRRIEREAGSSYRINGREARARDVKILFEDAATGARSPALVRQGQIGEIINAKPEARRRVLEDAAGIAGLASRRHEAELRLKAAEANLGRIADVAGGLRAQLEGLKRQARQARRYRELTSEIARTEALALYLKWRETQRLVDEAEGELGGILTRLAAAVAEEAAALDAERCAAEAMQPLRQAEAEKAGALGRLRSAQEAFEADAARETKRAAEVAARLAETERDLAREMQRADEARESAQRLECEIAALAAEQANAADEQGAALAAEAAQRVRLETAERDIGEVRHRLAAEQARRGAAVNALAERQRASERIARDGAAIAARVAAARTALDQMPSPAASAEAVARLEQGRADAERDLQAAEADADAASASLPALRQASERARLELNGLATERATLGRMIAQAAPDAASAVIDAMTVEPGYEAALGAAFGDDIEAPLDEAAPAHWRMLESADALHHDAALPLGAEPLASFVSAPRELTRRLSQIGIVSAEDGARLHSALAAGQMLVSRAGGLWRWDGFVAAPGSPSAAARRLEIRNRIAAIEREEALAAEAERSAAEALATANAAHTASIGRVAALRQASRRLTAELAAARLEHDKQVAGMRSAEAALATLAGAHERWEAERQDADAAFEAAAAAVAAFDEAALAVLAADVAEGDGAVLRLRTAYTECRAVRTVLEQRIGERDRRLGNARGEADRWRARHTETQAQIAALTTRLDTLKRERDGLDGLPERLGARRSRLLDELSAAEAARRDAADALAAAEDALRAIVARLKVAAAGVGLIREERARAEARLDAARNARREAARVIADMRDGATPETCLADAGVAAGAGLPALGEAERNLARLRADRERLGGVNLKADEDAVRIGAELARIEAEHGDVEAAIAKLRAGIGQLNREGRKRLNEAFAIVDGHFQRLFGVLFGGGEARLEMIQSADDPLEGGLEIVARPPGKKPATLSLLSGGEQTLTALSLIFAVFLTNPSPICVLDEVDAPLDDANVDRFCRMMESMAEETATRFLVITHHPMTMTRMDRLFGVTMAERGVSQLVSVDLETAQSFREAG
ncbi:MAG: chromosome segregation protein SMC [Hyphomicrobiaceae bacterium]|nr:chromosome segregation protein SMC [Hyphomicrobiaceae bacterium]